jgi:hypothetical protein
LATHRPAWRLVWRFAVSDGVPRRAFIVATIVGTVVSIINQADALWLGHSFNLWKFLLTFMVSYLVSTYGAVSLRLHGWRGDPPSGDAS